MRTVEECIARLCVINAIAPAQKEVAARRILRDFLDANFENPSVVDEFRAAFEHAELDGPVGDKVRSEIEIFEREREGADIRWSD